MATHFTQNNLPAAGGGGVYFILQGTVPAYRLEVFRLLWESPKRVLVFAGDDYFTADLSCAAIGEPWFRPVTNLYFLRRSFMWQKDSIWRLFHCPILAVELNPRILSTIAICLLRKLMKKPTIGWGHVGSAITAETFVGKVRRRMIGLSSAFVAYTSTDAAALEKTGYAFPIFVANNGCLSEKDCTFLKGDHPRNSIVYVGRLIPEKKVCLLVEAFALFASQNAEIPLLLEVVGAGPEKERILQSCLKLGISASVILRGRISEVSCLRDVYARSFVSVSPGYVGLSAIQSMGFGVPMLVARDEPHSPEIEACVDGETALFFNSDDPNDLCKALTKAFVFRMDGEKISSFIRQKYTFESMANAFQMAFERATPLMSPQSPSRNNIGISP